MATSLASQLQKLAVPQTQILERDKKRPSLLFDSKEAAAIDKDTFYEIGLSGLQDLKALDSDFSYFENNLFSPTSRIFERAVQDAETNESLNKTIRRFFMLLSPYFLLKPAHKALEWLIQRYLIHDYNKDDFLKLILPYHETNLFVKCLQLFNLKKNDSWKWLYLLQKNGLHLPKNTLYNHCISDVGFLKFIGKMILEAQENNVKSSSLTTLFNFYCTTTIGTLENVQELTEPQLTAILPPLLKGLSSDNSDFTASTYMITARLVKKTKLSNKLLNTLVEKISSKSQKNLRMEATLLLLLVYQSQQDHFNTFSDKAARNLAEKDWFVGSLGKLAADGSYILPLWKPVMCVSLKKIRLNKYRNLAEKLFSEIHLQDDAADILIRIVLEFCPSSTESNDDSGADSDKDSQSTESITEWYATFLKQIENKYPNAFDKIVRETLSNKSSAYQKQAQALKFVMNFAMSTGNQKSIYTIFEKLYHPSANFRYAAIDFLVRNFNDLTQKDKEIFQGAVSERLLDEDSRIIKAILKLQQKELINLLDENSFLDIVKKLLIKCFQNRKYLKIMPDLIKHICYGEISKNHNILLYILPYLFPVNDDELEISKKIIITDLTKNYAFLNDSKNQIKSIKVPAQFCELIYRNLLNNTTKLKIKVTKDMLNVHKYLSCILMVSSFPDKCVPEIGVHALLHINLYRNQSKYFKIRSEYFIFDCISQARKDLLPLQGLLECVKIILNKIDCSKLPENWLPSLFLNPSANFLVHAVKILIRGSHDPDKKSRNCYRTLFKNFLDKYFPEFKQKILFFANLILLRNENLINIKDKIRITKIMISLLQSKKSLKWAVELESNILMTSVLINLIHHTQEIRSVTFEIVEYLSEYKEVNNTFVSLCRELLKHKQDILLDSEQLPLIMCTLFENNDLKKIIFSLFGMIKDENIPIHVNSKLLKVLTFINSDEILEITSEVAINILKSVENENFINFDRSSIIYNVVLRFNENLASNIKLNSFPWELIKLALLNDTIRLEYQQQQYSCPSLLMLDQITPEIFNNLNINVKKALIESLVNIASVSENPNVVATTYKTVKKLDLDAKLLTTILTTMKDAKSNKTNTSQRKFRRVSEIPTIDILDTPEWKKGITVLEFIQDKKKLQNSDILLPVLFEILKKCLDFDEQAAVEYPKQIILSSLLHICNKYETTKLPTGSFNMELVVQCIRASQNPQTHHHALLVLAHAAALVPDQVLHNIMAIFTFMGSSVLRHDDAYSFQIISKIIDTVIPILVKENNESNVASVLRVFVDVILDIPEHRRVALFKKLLETLGVENYLWLFLVLVFEAHVVHGNDQSKQNDNPKRLDIATNITLEFKPEIILTTTIKLLEYLKSLPNDLSENQTNITDTFNIKQHTPKQFRHYKYTLVTFLSGLLSNHQLVNSIAVLDNENILKLEPNYKNMIIAILTYIQTVSKIVERTSNTPQAQYWKVILHHSFDIMDSINALLTTEMFLLVIRGLIVHNISTVRRKAMEILNNKLQHKPTFFNSSPEDDDTVDFEGLFTLIPSLLNIIKTVEESNIEPEQELTQQTALFSLKLLIKLLASRYPDKFISILNYITNLLKSSKLSDNILASVVLCLAELCSKLRAHAIPGLVRYMPALNKILKHERRQQAPGLLLMCIITAIQKIVESLPLFLSPYLEKLLCELTLLSAKWSDDNQKLVPFVKKLDSIRSNIALNIPSRILIPILIQSYNTLLKDEQYLAIGPLMNVLAENLSLLKGVELNNYLQDLTKFFLNALEFRNDHKDDFTDIVNIVEDNLIKTVTVLVLKLSETTFRPFYYRLFDWAVRNDEQTERIITFYRLSFNFAENLKSLFVLFAGHFVKNAAGLLNSCNTIKSDELYLGNETKTLLLIDSILLTLKSVFSYDCQNFVDKDRFETLMQPLVDQLENIIGGIESLQNRSEEILIPCIAQFAVAIADDSLWKQLNYQILLKMRHNLPEVRLVALNCLCGVARKLGEDFLPLLPETIPFLAELLEDEDEKVENQCRKVVQDLEKTLGEPLQKYF